MGDGVTQEEPPGDTEKAPRTYSDIFHEVFPHYLMMGMSPAEFWDGDSWLVIDYRNAYRMRKEQEYRERDEMAWSNGMYTRLALQSIYLMVNGFVPKGTTAEKYPEKPFTVQEKEKKQEDAKRKAEESKTKNAMAMFHAMTVAFNRGFAKRQLEEKLATVPKRT